MSHHTVPPGVGNMTMVAPNITFEPRQHAPSQPSRPPPNAPPQNPRTNSHSLPNNPNGTHRPPPRPGVNPELIFKDSARLAQAANGQRQNPQHAVNDYFYTDNPNLADSVFYRKPAPGAPTTSTPMNQNGGTTNMQNMQGMQGMQSTATHSSYGGPQSPPPPPPNAYPPPQPSLHHNSSYPGHPPPPPYYPAPPHPQHSAPLSQHHPPPAHHQPSTSHHPQQHYPQYHQQPQPYLQQNHSAMYAAPPQQPPMHQQPSMHHQQSSYQVPVSDFNQMRLSQNGQQYNSMQPMASMPMGGANMHMGVAPAAAMMNTQPGALQQQQNYIHPLNSQTATIGLEIWCKGLRNRDVVGKSDPIAVVSVESGGYYSGGVMGKEAELMGSTQGGMDIGQGNQHNGNVGIGGTNSVSGRIGIGMGAGAAGNLVKKTSALAARISGGRLLRRDQQRRWQEVGRTEAKKNDLNPRFDKQVHLDYFFGERQVVKISLWDVDSRKNIMDDRHHDFLGEAEMTIGDVIAKGVYSVNLAGRTVAEERDNLGRKRNLGQIFVRAHEKRNEDLRRITVGLAGRDLPRMDGLGVFGRSDPYFVVNRIIDDGVGLSGQSDLADTRRRKGLYRSEFILKSLNPEWKTAKFNLPWPKGGEQEDVKLEIKVYDRDEHSRDDFIGSVETTVHELNNVAMNTTGTMPLINGKKLRKEKKKKKMLSFGRKAYENSGILVVRKFSMVPVPSFMSYLQGGLHLHFTVAVDFTLSNKVPQNPASLHYIDQTGSNLYTQAIAAVGNVLAPYSPDNRYAALGFGAELPPSNKVSMRFSLSGQSDPHVLGVRGILDAYRRCLASVKLSGPTYFEPIIDHAMQLCSGRPARQDDQHYDVLLILTDGVINDMAKTIDAIISAATMGLSIIIVGIGDADFSRMKHLDSDNDSLTSADGKRKASRDIVQFVDFKKFAHRTPERLASHLLCELPRNVVEYFFNMKDITPNPPQTGIQAIPAPQF